MEGGSRKGRTEAQTQSARTTTMHGMGCLVTARVMRPGRASLHAEGASQIRISDTAGSMVMLKWMVREYARQSTRGEHRVSFGHQAGTFELMLPATREWREEWFWQSGCRGRRKQAAVRWHVVPTGSTRNRGIQQAVVLQVKSGNPVDFEMYSMN